MLALSATYRSKIDLTVGVMPGRLRSGRTLYNGCRGHRPLPATLALAAAVDVRPIRQSVRLRTHLLVVVRAARFQLRSANCATTAAFLRQPDRQKLGGTRTPSAWGSPIN